MPAIDSGLMPTSSTFDLNSRWSKKSCNFTFSLSLMPPTIMRLVLRFLSASSVRLTVAINSSTATLYLEDTSSITFCFHSSPTWGGVREAYVSSKSFSGRRIEATNGDG